MRLSTVNLFKDEVKKQQLAPRRLQQLHLIVNLQQASTRVNNATLTTPTNTNTSRNSAKKKSQSNYRTYPQFREVVRVTCPLDQQKERLIADVADETKQTLTAIRRLCERVELGALLMQHHVEHDAELALDLVIAQLGALQLLYDL